MLLTLAGIGGLFDALALIAASVAFTAAAIFLVMSLIFRRSSRRLSITYQPLASQRPDDAP